MCVVYKKWEKSMWGWGEEGGEFDGKVVRGKSKRKEGGKNLIKEKYQQESEHTHMREESCDEKVDIEAAVATAAINIIIIMEVKCGAPSLALRF